MPGRLPHDTRFDGFTCIQILSEAIVAYALKATEEGVEEVGIFVGCVPRRSCGELSGSDLAPV